MVTTGAELGGCLWRVSAARAGNPGRTWRVFSTERSARRCLERWDADGYEDLRVEACMRGPWQRLDAYERLVPGP